MANYSDFDGFFRIEDFVWPYFVMKGFYIIYTGQSGAFIVLFRNFLSLTSFWLIA